MEQVLKDAAARVSGVISNGDDDIDVFLALQEYLVQEARAYATLVKRPEITDQFALEAICFLAVVETQVGLDDDLLKNCLNRLGVSYSQLWGTILILERCLGIAAVDFLTFIIGFTKNLHQQSEVLSGGYN